MERVLNNGMNNAEFEVFCANYQASKSQKEIDWLDFTCFILSCIEDDEDMGFTKAELYADGSCFDEDEELIKYSSSEKSIWDNLFKLTGTEDLEDLLNKFVGCKWCDNNNTAIVELENGEKFVILRL